MGVLPNAAAEVYLTCWFNGTYFLSFENMSQKCRWDAEKRGGNIWCQPFPLEAFQWTASKTKTTVHLGGPGDYRDNRGTDRGHLCPLNEHRIMKPRCANKRSTAWCGSCMLHSRPLPFSSKMFTVFMTFITGSCISFSLVGLFYISTTKMIHITTTQSTDM